MKKNSRKRMFRTALACLVALSTVFGPLAMTGVQTVRAAEPAADAEPYTIYPNPHELTYGGKRFDVSGTVNVVYESHVDHYTKERVEEMLTSKGLTFNESAEPADGMTNFLVGVNGSGEAVDRYFRDRQLTDETVLKKLDANIVSVQDQVIAVLGKDPDAAFYGVTTVKHLFKQMDGRTIEELTVKDYADVKGRGFIEGYYGEPWSNEDRADLMTFGGDFKMNSYIYAPKDDPKHNGKWRELYTAEELVSLSELAEAGNASKTRFVYTLHPFMNNAIRFDTEANYQNDLALIQKKFTQLLDAGVRKFGILSDDAAVPPQGAETYVRLMTDLTDWLVAQQGDYEGLVTDMIFCPNDYMGWGQSAQIQALRQLPDSVSLVQTGGKVWGEVSENFTSSFTANAGRGPFLWINWPCTDNSKQHLIMGGQDVFLQPNVDPANIEGIVLNPMQQSEPSKVAIFANADYAWNIWSSSEQADRNWNDAFAYVDHASGEATDASDALKELSKHMINQNMDGRVAKLEESVDLAPKLTAFRQALGKEPVAGQAAALITEFETIREAARTYKERPGNTRTRDQIIYWLDSAEDTADAALALLKAEIAHERGDKAAVWENYSQGQAAFDASKNHPFRYIDHYQYAEVGVQHIVPFVKALLSDVSLKVQSIVDPDWTPALEPKLIAPSHFKIYQGSEANLFDGDDATFVWYDPSGAVKDTSVAGDYIGVDLQKTVQLGKVSFDIGRDNADKWTEYQLEYSVDNVTYTPFKSYTGKASGMDAIREDLTGIEARYVRVKNLKDVPVWVKFSGIHVETAARDAGFTYTNNDAYKGISAEHSLENTSLSPTEGLTLQPGQYVGVKLERIKELAEVAAAETSGALTLQVSVNAVEWAAPAEGTFARYVRFINNTDRAITFDLTQFRVTSHELHGPEFVGTTMGTAPNWSENDSRKKGTLLNLFDKDFSTKTIFADYQRKGESITYSVGEPRVFDSLRIYNDEDEINYIRDAKVQLSMDNNTWTDVAEVGDGLDNTADGKPDYADKIKDGYTHDTANPGNYYFGNDDIGGIEAKYIRILFTANYPHRFANINEILINGGEFVKTENNPTFTADPVEVEGSGPDKLFDGDLTTAFKPDMTGRTDGSLTYRLSEKTDATAVTIVQGSNNISNATVRARVGTDEWVELGTLDSSLNTFYNPSYAHIFEIKLTWGDVQPLIYEMNVSNNPDLVDKVSKEALAALISEADGKAQDGYTADSWKPFADALQRAKDVHQDPDAGQAAVDSAAAALKAAMDQLEENSIREIADLYPLVARYSESGDIADKKAVNDLVKQIGKIEKAADKGKDKDNHKDEDKQQKEEAKRQEKVNKELDKFKDLLDKLLRKGQLTMTAHHGLTEAADRLFY